MTIAVVAEALDVDCSLPNRDPQAAAVDVQLEMAHRLAIVAEYRDDDTGAHAARVGAVSGAIARALGLAADSAGLIELAAPLHDLGKVAIADAILLKPGVLNDAERRTMEEHTTIGARMLENSPMPVLQVARAIALSHHERWDGGGYPHRLGRAQIPLPGRIVAIADVFDALTHERPFKHALAVEEALEEIKRLSGRQFDPDVVSVFERLEHETLL